MHFKFKMQSPLSSLKIVFSKKEQK